jgi:DNA-binding GntR family transcriptional regulator
VTSPDGKRLRYAEIAADIRDRIRKGKLLPGSRVGTFRSLGEEYDAAKGTVDKALDVLRQEGAVVTIAGKGIYVADSVATEASSGRGGDRRAREQIEALTEEVRGLRKAVADLQAQIMNLYHSVGQPYPYGESATTEGRKAV